ncbi:hypothetical protein V3O24_13035 [Methylobacter sp. Wu8]|uniref:hypothetical protein n=1 Tax=Methylobacter sp. Wu8 TaxID=3118457 RepID=UPI002F31D69C
MAETSKVTPGINPNLNLEHFSEEEKNVIKKLSSDWYITNGGGVIKLAATSSYKYFLLKPTPTLQELFNIEREIIAVFSDYSDFEPRTLDAFDYAINKHQELRIERVCSVLISRDKNIEVRIRDLLKSDAEYQIIVPFNFKEILENSDSFFVRNRFREYFYSRDLFSFQAPLKKDLYFFGRTDLVHTLVNRHRSSENAGLFGLRKTGKTSIIFGIRRVIEVQGGVSVFIDCQNPSFHKKRWFSALRYVIDELKSQNKFSVKTSDESKYSEEEAATTFEKDLLKIYGGIKKKNFLLIFDEIEHITPGISASEHWKNGSDFVFFWQALRYIFQKHNQLFTYLIAGTNPKCVEIDRINGVDNPIFCQIPYEYIPSFDVPQTREMVRTLGRIMGLQFDEPIYSKLTEDFGGHPFLIRNVCSVINKLVSEEQRPVRIDKSVYEQGVRIFNEQYSNYIEMILTVLKEYYNDEYEMLKYLALGDMEMFNGFSNISKEYTNHLLGYGILDRNLGSFTFKIESIKIFLVEANKYKKLNLSEKEMLAEISERRNSIEPKLREIVRKGLRQCYGESEAKSKVLDIYGEKRKSKYSPYSYKDIFDPKKSEIYFEDIRKIIEKEWQVFENLFGKDKQSFNAAMQAVNKYRADAHAKLVTKEEMDCFRVFATKLENYISEQD